MANSDARSTTCTVRVLVSFYLAATDDSSSARTSPIHKEKFNVPLSGDEHKDLFNFVRHLKTFTGLAEIAKSKGKAKQSRQTALGSSEQHQTVTKHEAGTLPLNMYRKELPVCDRVTEELS